ncbi:hypothetical protein QJS83_13465 [Bdellovibrio sp. 22V]|uniref:hypothetical protein n=1 Tax=Bdellovibrio TaxID=958 RepID=UPI002542F1F8|nr:hypothetical protein [Bdellovibrio sp. 22V]WII71472.1 hypothetical protein QJS83_13465 [Bdellovibrio sp. 22V]
MIRELWSSFPRLLEEKINALLDEAEPTPTKAFQLYKTCQRESLWHETFEKFSERLNDFFMLPKNERKKSAFDRYLDRPMHMAVFENFHLDFRSALVNNGSVLNIASWAHHLMRLNMKSNSAVIGTDVLTKTLHYITNPPQFEKAQDITFDDFCAAWKKTVFKLFGKKYDSEFQKIEAELRWLNTQIKAAESSSQEPVSFFPTIYLTQTEIDWVTAVQTATQENITIPKFPLSRGPQKQRLIDLARTISLYKIVQTTKLPEFIQHRDRIRATLLDQCGRILAERAR